MILNLGFLFLGTNIKTSCIFFCKNKQLVYGLISNLLIPHLDCDKLHEANLRFEMLVVSTFLIVFLFLRLINLFFLVNLDDIFGLFMTVLCVFIGGVPAAMTIIVSYCILMNYYFCGFAIFFTLNCVRLMVRMGVLSDAYQKFVNFVLEVQNTFHF